MILTIVQNSLFVIENSFSILFRQLNHTTDNGFARKGYVKETLKFSTEYKIHRPVASSNGKFGSQCVKIKK